MYERNDSADKETYEIYRPIAVDAWGEIHQAMYRPHKRDLLVRILPEKVGSVEGAWRLLCAEIQAWARIRHKSVLQVMDWGQSGGRYYFATEMPSGKTLDSVVSADEGVENPDEVFINLLKGIEVARHWGVIHLGLSPTNIWLSADGSVEIADYGLWYVTREFPGIGEENGLFMAPEQIEGGRVNASTDVYSLGLVYLALRYGLDAARAAAGGAPLPVDLGAMRPVISRCLDKQPIARYRATREMAGDLGLNTEAWLTEEHLDCPLCRLRDEIMSEREQGGFGGPGSHGGEASGVETWIWFVAGALFIAVVVSWLLVLR